MEDKAARLVEQQNFEKVVREIAEENLKSVKKERFSRFPEGFRRVGRFALYNILTNLPKDSFNKHYTRNYLPIGMRHHLIIIFSSIVLMDYTLKKIYPPSYY